MTVFTYGNIMAVLCAALGVLMLPEMLLQGAFMLFAGAIFFALERDPHVRLP